MRERDGRADERTRSAVWCLAPLMIALGDCTDVGRRTGVYLTVLTLCPLTGTPISGIIYAGVYSVVRIYVLAGRFPFFTHLFVVSLKGLVLMVVSMPTKYAIFDDSEIHIRSEPVATSEVSQPKGKVHRHFIVAAGSHTNHDKLRIGVIQVENCQLPKEFSGPPIGNRAPVRKSIKGWSGACFSLLNFIINRVNHLW